MTPERLAALEAAAAANDEAADAVLESMLTPAGHRRVRCAGSTRRGRLARGRPALQPQLSAGL